MKKVVKLCLFFLVSALLFACSNGVSEESLQEGSWETIDMYVDGERLDESGDLIKNLEFKEDGTVYVNSYEADFVYQVEKDESGTKLSFTSEELGRLFSYELEVISDDEIELTGTKGSVEGQKIHLERIKENS